MTVGELIEELSKYEPTTEVAVYADDYEFSFDGPVTVAREAKAGVVAGHQRGCISPEDGALWGVHKVGPVYLVAVNWGAA